MKKLTWIGVVVLLLVVALGFVLTKKNRLQKPKQEILVGVILPLTGKAATYGERSLQGIQIAVDQVISRSNLPCRRLCRYILHK